MVYYISIDIHCISVNVRIRNKGVIMIKLNVSNGCKNKAAIQESFNKLSPFIIEVNKRLLLLNNKNITLKIYINNCFTVEVKHA